MCLAADVPLIESGTTGFDGQVQIIKKVILDKFHPQKEGMADNDRAKPNATIATPKRHLKHFLFVLSGAHLVNLYIASSGRRVTCLRMCCHFPQYTILITRREIFGTGEDDTPELDHTDDSENGKYMIIWIVFQYSLIFLQLKRLKIFERSRKH